ncbi:ABC transporter ATP-binding protein [Clostridium sp. 'White wine YQ']|uniref:ABC transporter ATP-binding protein n=1 Tax=Clostridium sp. 'White wine YQ' TaxID=3027474 RepID=UPI0023655DF0|nr:ATP-binding cassette domain-containing protein [Clostridium sp. 'White wine YQ']MDD7794126.1 ATP-binding cassette domain-containing protein [Clostridium sp. 'White wine YQ']
MSLLELKNINLNYHSKSGEIKTLTNIDLKLNQGEFITVLGPSGCGKSTLLNIISGLIPPSSGDITFKNEPLELNKDKMGYMFQKDHLFPWLSVWNNVILPLKIKHELKKEKLEKAEELLKAYSLWEFKDRLPTDLSGGMRQRVALIRTLTLDPELLLLDEPFSALDYLTRLKVCDEVYDIIKKEGKTAIMVTHDISEAISLSQRVIILSRRPAYVKKELTINFSEDADTPFKRRKEENFRKYFDEIWGDLDEQ